MITKVEKCPSVSAGLSTLVYVRTTDADVQIRPVWKDHTLGFESGTGEAIEWIPDGFPYLRLHMAVHWEHNQLSNQKETGYGQIVALKNNLLEWIGPTDKVYATILTGGVSQVKVRAATKDWHPLNIRKKLFIEPHQLSQLPSHTLDFVEFGHFQEVPLDPTISKPRRRFGPIPVFPAIQRMQQLDHTLQRLSHVIEKLTL